MSVPSSLHMDDISRRIVADLYGVVNSFSKGPSASSPSKSPTTNLLKTFEKNLVDSSSVQFNLPNEDMSLNKHVFRELWTIGAESVRTMMQFLKVDTNLYQRMSTAFFQILAIHDVELVDKNRKKVKDTVYNREEIKNASNRMLIAAAIELFFLGYTVFAVKKDLIEHCTENTLYHDASSPLRTTSATGKIRGKAANRMPYTYVQNSSGILPYAHIDIEGGDLQAYLNIREATSVYAYVPVRADIKALEKRWRFFVIVNPNKSMVPHNGVFQTGICNTYQAWSRWRFALTTYQAAMAHLGSQTVYANYQPGKINMANLTAQEQAASTVRVGNIRHDMSEQEQEELWLKINNKAAGPRTASLVSMLLLQGSSRNKQTGALTETRACVKAGIMGLTNGGISAGSMQGISSIEHDKYEYDMLDQSRIAGNMRAEHLVLMPPGSIVSHVITPVANKDAIVIMLNAYNAEVDGMFALLTQTTGISIGASRTSVSSEIDAKGLQHRRSESEAMYVLKYLFHVIYVEWGAVLDQMGPIGALTLINESLRSIRMVGTLRDYIAMKAIDNKVDINVLLAYLSKENTRRAFAMKTSGKTDAASVVTADKAIAVTLENFTRWDTVMRSYQGLSRLFAVLYRSMSASSDGNLFMEFKPTIMPTDQFGGGGGLSSPAALSAPAPGQG